jgi:hypothetical protein
VVYPLAYLLAWKGVERIGGATLLRGINPSEHLLSEGLN